MESMLGPSFWPPFLASSLAAAFTTLGILVIRRYRVWAKHNSIYFICFAAGVLISVSLLHIAPRAFAIAPYAPAYLLAGYLTLHFSNHFITAGVCDLEKRADFAIGIVALLGIGFHSFIDGAIYSITFRDSFFTGLVSAIGMVLHEFPEGVVTYVLLLRAGFSERHAVILAFIAAALTTPLGMVVSFPFISLLESPILGALLGASAGVLIYVGTTHLLPQSEREPRRFTSAALLLGVATAVGIIVLKA
jgi:zinc transporter ZupT